MRTSDKGGAHAVPAQGMLLLDRRRRQLEALKGAMEGLVLKSVYSHRSPLGPTVWVGEIVSVRGREVPRHLEVAGHVYSRVLDRFYLPRTPNPAVSTALFDICAPAYDALVDVDRNVRNIARLLTALCGHLTITEGRLRILDFGCGTGLSTRALGLIPPAIGQRIDLLGTDASPAMLEIASSRNMRVVTLAEWKTLPQGCLHGAFASYVLHCGIWEGELALIGSQLMRNSLFVANYHHGSPDQIRDVRESAWTAGLCMQELSSTDPFWERDPVLVFSRRVDR